MPNGPATALRSDPIANRGDLLFVENEIRIDWRHPLVGVFGRQAVIELAVLGLTGNDESLAARCRAEQPAADIEPQIGLAHFGVRPMTAVTVVREDRPHVAMKLHRRRGRPGSRQVETANGDEKQDNEARHGRSRRGGPMQPSGLPSILASPGADRSSLIGSEFLSQIGNVPYNAAMSLTAGCVQLCLFGEKAWPVVDDIGVAANEAHGMGSRG